MKSVKQHFHSNHIADASHIAISCWLSPMFTSILDLIKHALLIFVFSILKITSLNYYLLSMLFYLLLSAIFSKTTKCCYMVGVKTLFYTLHARVVLRSLEPRGSRDRSLYIYSMIRMHACRLSVSKPGLHVLCYIRSVIYYIALHSYRRLASILANLLMGSALCSRIFFLYRPLFFYQKKIDCMNHTV